MPVANPLYDFAPEPISVSVTSRPVHTPSSPPATRASVPASTPAMRASSPARTAMRSAAAVDVISPLAAFVLGFALATSIAWLASTSADERVVKPVSGQSASLIGPVLVAASTPIAAATPIVTSPAAPVTPPAAQRAPAPAPPQAAPRLATPRPRLAASAAAAASTVRSSGARRQTITPFRGSLAVSSQPDGAQVLLNGAVVGKTPMVLENLPTGSRVLLVRRDGYAVWSKSVRVVADQRTSIQASLDRLSTP
jgi:hypothetical protein